MPVCRRSLLQPSPLARLLRSKQLSISAARLFAPRTMTAVTEQPVWKTKLLQSWQMRGCLAWLLWPLSLVFGALTGLRRWLYRNSWLSAQWLPVPVIVVGNVIVGGAGKTPVVLALVNHLQRRGLQVGVVSRGYGRRTQGCLMVTQASAAHDVGDEPALIHRYTGVPVFVSECRVAAVRALLAAAPDTQLLISDDGLQHLPLRRNLEIAVFDDRGIGNGFLLPAGPLREPWPRHPDVDMVLHTGQHASPAGFVMTRHLADHAVRSDGSTITLADVAAAPGAPVLALAAIARPEVFFTMLRAQGVPLARVLVLPDHFDFSRFNTSDYQGYRIICTEKDAVKLWSLRPDALAVPLRCELSPAFWSTFDARVDALLRSGWPL